MFQNKYWDLGGPKIQLQLFVLKTCSPQLRNEYQPFMSENKIRGNFSSMDLDNWWWEIQNTISLRPGNLGQSEKIKRNGLETDLILILLWNLIMFFKDDNTTVKINMFFKLNFIILLIV